MNSLIRFIAFAAAVIVGSIGFAGCPGPSSAPAPDGGSDAATSGSNDAATDAGSADAGVDAGPLVPLDQLDLLFVIDNSTSMMREQMELARQLQAMIDALVSGSSDSDPEPEFTPFQSIHVGVISSDMGTAGIDVHSSCSTGDRGNAFGDDGVLRTEPAETIDGCGASYPAVFQFMHGDDSAAFAQDLACVTTLGTAGCGMEQQLEAALKALSPAAPTDWTADGYVAPVFSGETRGHAGPGAPNAGFVREDSALAIVVLTDEDDCSVSDPSVYTDSSPLNLRCYAGGMSDRLHPIERYVGGTEGASGLLQLRRDPHRLLFAAIVGVPEAAISDPLDVDYDAILAHPLMQEEVNELGVALEPSCDAEGSNDDATPPRRIVATAQALEAAGASATVQSICAADYTSTFRALAARFAEVANR